VPWQPGNRSGRTSASSDVPAADQTGLPKACSKCGRVLPLSEFSRRSDRNNARSSACRACRRRRGRIYRRKYRDLINLRNRLRRRRNVLLARMKHQDWRDANRQRLRRQSCLYRAAHKARIAAYNADYWRRNREKRSAYVAVRAALIMGDLVRRPCEICLSLGLPSSRRTTHAHHEDYDRPLDVRWLCPQHHQRLHAGRFSLLPVAQ